MWFFRVTKLCSPQTAMGRREIYTNSGPWLETMLKSDADSSQHKSHKYLSNLCTPVKKNLGSNIFLVFADIVQETTQRHQLCNQHHLGCHAHSQDPDTTGVFHWGHYSCLLQQLLILARGGAVGQNFNGDRNFDILILGYPKALQRKNIMSLSFLRRHDK